MSLLTATHVFEKAVARHGEDNVTAYTISETYESMQGIGELTRMVLARETGWTLRPEMLSRHVVCANTLEGPAGPPAMEDRRRRVARPGQATINKEVVERPRPDSASGVTAEVMAPQPCSCRRRNAAGGDLPSSARTGA